MNKVVKEHYPVADLPADLRASFPGSGYVKVTVEVETPRKSLAELLAELPQRNPQETSRGVTLDEAVARVRALRDEWDD